MLFERYQRWAILVHGAEPPRPQEWADYVEEIRQLQESGGIGACVLTDGVGPNATQRKMVTQFNMRCAVVTSSRVACAMVTALHWAGLGIKAFTPDDLVEPLVFLDVPPVDHKPMIERMAAMRLALAGEHHRPTSSLGHPELQKILTMPLQRARP